MNEPCAGPRRIKSKPDPLNQYVRSELCASECEVEADTPAASEKSTFRIVRLGAVEVLRCEGFGMRWTRRGHHHVRLDHSDDFLIGLPIRANILVTQAGSMAHVSAGGLVCVSSAKPFVVCTSGPTPASGYSLYLLRIPATLLRRHVPRIDHCCSRSVKLRPGAGRILLGMVEQALAEGGALSADQARRFGTMLIDAVANVTLEAPELLPLLAQSRESSHARVVQLARQYIESNLSDSALTNLEIAQVCKVSVRYLNAAFAAQSTTVGGYVRECRLQRCRDELSNPALRDKSIGEIAMRWGFNDAAYFSRAYKGKFGVAPSAERKALRKA